MYINNQGEIEFIKPFDKQLEVVEAWEDPNIFYKTVVAGRQSSKTKITQNLAPKTCLEQPGITVMWVSPSDNQAKKAFRRCWCSHQQPKWCISFNKCTTHSKQPIKKNTYNGCWCL